MAKDRVKDLATAVARAFQRAGFSPTDLLQGQIAFTELSWAAPPLQVEASLAQLPLSTYLDYPVRCDSERFYEFYCEALYNLHADPSAACNYGGFKGLGKAVASSQGERLLRFPLPAGFPENMDHMAGQRFALDAAHFARTSLPLSGFVEDESNYFAQTEWGHIGVEEGLPTLYADLWDTSVEGQVPSMLTEPRGMMTTECHYDLVARVRSALYENMDKFDEFEGIDLALQALRLLASGRACTELLAAVQGMSLASFQRRRKAQIVKECIETMETWSLNDRTKLSMLFEKLVPEVLNMSEYQRKIIDPYKLIPSVISTKVEARIINTLKHLKGRYENADAS